jgi:hypothetical protein
MGHLQRRKNRNKKITGQIKIVWYIFDNNLSIYLIVKDMEGPKLIENSSMNYLRHSLYTCHEKRIKHYSNALNIMIFVTFVGIFGSALYLCYNKQETPYEKHRRNLKDQEYILEKIRFVENEKLQQAESLTNLPYIYSPMLPV